MSEDVVNKRMVLGIVAGAVVLVGGLALAGTQVADHRSERARHFLGWKLDDALDGIDADDAQRKIAHQLKDQLFDEWLKVKATHEQVRAGLVESSATRSARPSCWRRPPGASARPGPSAR